MSAVCSPALAASSPRYLEAASLEVVSDLEFRQRGAEARPVARPQGLRAEATGEPVVDAPEQVVEPVRPLDVRQRLVDLPGARPPARERGRGGALARRIGLARGL